MTVEEILELMDELLDKSSSVPFSQKKMIDVEQMREYIDSIRLNLPGEIKRAKDMTRDKKNILTEANKEAEEIVKKAKKLVAQEEIIKQAADYAKQIAAEANKQAADIVEQAKAKDKAIREALSENLNKSLSEAAEVLTKSLKDVNTTRDAVSKIGAAEK